MTPLSHRGRVSAGSAPWKQDVPSCTGPRYAGRRRVWIGARHRLTFGHHAQLRRGEIETRKVATSALRTRPSLIEGGRVTTLPHPRQWVLAGLDRSTQLRCYPVQGPYRGHPESAELPRGVSRHWPRVGCRPRCRRGAYMVPIRFRCKATCDSPFKGTGAEPFGAGAGVASSRSSSCAGQEPSSTAALCPVSGGDAKTTMGVPTRARDPPQRLIGWLRNTDTRGTFCSMAAFRHHTLGRAIRTLHSVRERPPRYTHTHPIHYSTHLGCRHRAGDSIGRRHRTGDSV